jgi:nucleobase:cation symporter-1, NCS1 family
METAQSASDRVGEIENRGIAPVPEAERHGHAGELLWVWLAANIGVLGVTLGAGLVTFEGLNVWQALFVAFIGAAGSFALVGALSIAGKWTGAPGLTTSRAVFGVRGNLGPTLVSWISLVGWETILSVTATYAMLALFEKVFGIHSSDFWIVVALLCVVALTAVIGLLGHATIMFVQRWATLIFGVISLVVVGYLIGEVDWGKVGDIKAGSTSSVIAGIGLIAAGTGIGWLNAGADYARYLPRREKGASITGWVTVGATIPLVVLMMIGALLAAANTGLAGTDDPVGAIGGALPSWMSIPYLITAVGGLVTATVLSLYSSGLNLLAMGIPVKRTAAIAVDATIIVAGGIYIMIIRESFYGPFITFLTLLAIPLTAWAAVFGVDMIQRRGYDAEELVNPSPGGRYWYRSGFCWEAIASWAIAILIGLAFTKAAVSEEEVWFTGPLAHTWLGDNNLGWLIGFVVAGCLYGGSRYLTGRRSGGERASDQVSDAGVVAGEGVAS